VLDPDKTMPRIQVLIDVQFPKVFGRMWTVVWLVLLFSSLGSLEKLDYELEEFNLFCAFEQLSGR
jgi:hypothetical protein